MVKKWMYIVLGTLFLFCIAPNLSVYAKDYVEKEILLVLKEQDRLQMYHSRYNNSEDNLYLQTGKMLSGEKFSINDLENYGIKEIEKKEIKIETEQSNENITFSISRNNNTFTYYKISLEENTVLETVEALERLDNVVVAEPNYLYYAEELQVPNEDTDPLLGQQMYLDYPKVKTAWETLAAQGKEPGKDVVIALLDTGVFTTHEDLQDSLWENELELFGEEGIDDDGNGFIDDIYGYNFVADNGNVKDTGGHGTQMAGIMSMTARNQVGGCGIAYGAKLMPVKVSNKGSFDTDTVVQGIAYAVNQGADILNMSFGGNMQSVVLQTALQQAANHCILVAAAGNAGTPSVSEVVIEDEAQDIYPAGYDCVIGVMSHDLNGQLSSFSNWDSDMSAGASYNIIAPGNAIYSTTYRGKYEVGKGTSQAAAAVSAVAAIMRGIYTDREVWTAPILQKMFLEAMTDSITYEYSAEVSLEYPLLNAMNVIEYAIKEEQLLDGIPPQAQDMTNGIYYVKEKIPFTVYAQDNRTIETVNLYYRSSGIKVYSKEEMVLQENGSYQTSTPVEFYSPGKVEYFFEVYDGTYYTYVGSRDCPQTLYIYKANIVDVDVSGLETKYYTGKPIFLDIIIKYGGKQLEEGIHYTLSYENNIEIGTAILHINGLGEYYGSTFLEFRIVSPPQLDDLPEQPKPGDTTTQEPIDTPSQGTGDSQLQNPSDTPSQETGDSQLQSPSDTPSSGTGDSQLQSPSDTPSQEEELPDKDTDTKKKKARAPGKVYKITVKKKKSGVRKYSWKKPTGKITGYYIYVSKKKYGNYKKIATVKKRSYSLTIKQRKKYRYIKIAAWYKSGTKRLVGKKSKVVKIK